MERVECCEECEALLFQTGQTGGNPLHRVVNVDHARKGAMDTQPSWYSFYHTHIDIFSGVNKIMKTNGMLKKFFGGFRENQVNRKKNTPKILFLNTEKVWPANCFFGPNPTLKFCYIGASRTIVGLVNKKWVSLKNTKNLATRIEGSPQPPPLKTLLVQRLISLY